MEISIKVTRTSVDYWFRVHVIEFSNILFCFAQVASYSISEVVAIFIITPRHLGTANVKTSESC